MNKIKSWLAALSYTTGLYVLGICVICYIMSFAQMLLPLSATTKWVLWFVFFGLAKTAQYTGLLILGKSGLEKIHKYIKKRNAQT